MRRSLDPSAPLNDAFLSAVSETIDGFLDAQQAQLSEIGVLPLLDVAREATSGGKRLRPGFCYWSHVAAAGYPADDSPLLAVASSLDLLQASALVHDDLIDDSDTRRGRPAAHKRFELFHGERKGRGHDGEFGRSSAILLGDLLLMWSIEMADASRAEGLDRARPLLSVMRSEVTAGQFLDVSAQYGVAGAASVDDEIDVARRVLEYKSARYSIRRPAQIGAALAHADEDLQAALGEFGSVIGRAFQLRDDVLGVFGDPAITGKPYGGDIREGKRTVLVLTALADGDPDATAQLDELLGSPGLSEADVDRAAALIDASGARGKVEELIERNTAHALEILENASMTDDGRTALAELAARSVQRVH
ncbi:MAG TPA: polyprenyl synthetase family protein [Tessaracoccus flavescens]|uniref:Polyprenyl synthetase family protein n=1 Tax=Tessaracoccus flavescens TaxID=399497 RepID=A0A921JQ96_9ACTN|nr:polyprenyl synthetase family protein [Tessaracoccus flavescens]